MSKFSPNNFDNFDPETEVLDIYTYSGDGDPADSFLGLGNKRKKAAKKQRKAEKQLSKGHTKKAAKKARKAARYAGKVTRAAEDVAASGTSLEQMKQATTAAQTQATQANATSPVAYDPLSASSATPPTSLPSGGGGGGSDNVPDYGSTYADTTDASPEEMNYTPGYIGDNPDEDTSDVSYETDAPEDTTEAGGDFDILGWLFGGGETENNFTGDEPTGKLAETKTLDTVTVKTKPNGIVVAIGIIALVYFMNKI